MLCQERPFSFFGSTCGSSQPFCGFTEVGQKSGGMSSGASLEIDSLEVLPSAGMGVAPNGVAPNGICGGILGMPQ